MGDRSRIKSTRETVVRVGMLLEIEVEMKVKSSRSCHLGEQHVPCSYNFSGNSITEENTSEKQFQTTIAMVG